MHLPFQHFLYTTVSYTLYSRHTNLEHAWIFLMQNFGCYVSLENIHFYSEHNLLPLSSMSPLKCHLLSVAVSAPLSEASSPITLSHHPVYVLFQELLLYLTIILHLLVNFLFVCMKIKLLGMGCVVSFSSMPPFSNLEHFLNN